MINLKIIILNERGEGNENFYDYVNSSYTKCKLIYSNKKQMSNGVGVGRRGLKEGLPREDKKLSQWVMDMFIKGDKHTEAGLTHTSL